MAGALSLCRLESSTASPSPPTALSGAGAVETLACWATADEQTQLLPKKIEAFTDQRVVTVSGRGHSLATTAPMALSSLGATVAPAV